MICKRFLCIIVLALGAIVLSTTQTSAQVQGTGIGPKAGLYLNLNHFFIGGTMELPLTADITLEPGAELVFGVLNSTVLIVDGNARYSFILTGLDVSPYAMAGLGLGMTAYSDGNVSSTNFDLRLNVGGGVTFSTRSTVQPWGGLKIIFNTGAGGGSDIALQGGVNFYL